MQYTERGFDQTMLSLFNKEKFVIEKGKTRRKIISLDARDVLLLNWFVDLISLESSNKFRKFKNKADQLEYINIRYKKVAMNFPLYFRYIEEVKETEGIPSEEEVVEKKMYDWRGVERSFKKLSEFGLLKHYHRLTKEGSFSCYRVNKELITLIRYKGKQSTDLEYANNLDSLIQDYLIPNGFLITKEIQDWINIECSTLEEWETIASKAGRNFFHWKEKDPLQKMVDGSEC